MSRRRGAVVAAQAGLALARAAAAQEVPEDPSVLPNGPHRDEVFYLCTACHSARLVRNQALSRERWDETLAWMSERHGMPKVEGEDTGAIRFGVGRVAAMPILASEHRPAWQLSSCRVPGHDSIADPGYRLLSVMRLGWRAGAGGAGTTRRSRTDPSAVPWAERSGGSPGRLGRA